MSKMTRPSVEVVRFTESDVIVASGGVTPLSPPLYINGFTNTMGSGDGTMTWNSVQYNYDTQAELTSVLCGLYGTEGDGVRVTTTGKVENILYMFSVNHSDNWREVETATGNYYWNPSAKRWEYNYGGQ